MEKKYADAGMQLWGKPFTPPHILFWNLRATTGFPCTSNQANVTMFSGFSPALLNNFCNKGLEGLKNVDNKVDSMSDLKITTNSLFDIIQYLKDGNMVCLHTRNDRVYFHFPDSINEKLIYIDVSSMPSLMDNGEWPWYIKNAGFVEYESILNLPINQTFYRI